MRPALLLALLALVVSGLAFGQDAGVQPSLPPVAARDPIRVAYWLAECDSARPPTPRYTGPGDLWGEVREWSTGREVSMLLQTPTGRVMAEAYRLGVRETGWRTWSIRGPRRLYRWQLARPARCRIVGTYRDAYASTDVLWRDWISARVDQAAGRFLPPVLYGGEDDDARGYLAQED
ncbi:MAG: hypothetical protein MUC88_23280 [Planctomycetes bacterium]|jgi:hypothetical protein|nr:hypothetical protein [Planctomycetota bacterium]